MIRYLESSYPTYKALYQRVHNGDSPVEISRPLSREKGMTIDASNMPKEINAVLMNTIGNPGGEHLKNEDIAKVVEAILKNHDEALIVLDEAYQGISGDVKDKFKNIGDFLEKYPQLKGKVKFIELLSTSKIGRGPGDRMAGIVVDPAISGSFSSYYRPTQLGVPRFAQFFWSNVAKRSTEEIQTSSKQSYEAFHANNQLLTDELSTACPNAFVPPHEGGMFNVVDIKGEYEARLGAKLGQLNLREKMDTSFSVPEFVKTTITDHIVNGHVVYFTSVDKKSCLRVNLGDTPENIKQFAKDLDTALTLFVESKVKQIQERENQETA
jgi:aspartate/methionine/tyrosine aminotransferase